MLEIVRGYKGRLKIILNLQDPYFILHTQSKFSSSGPEFFLSIYLTLTLPLCISNLLCSVLDAAALVCPHSCTAESAVNSQSKATELRHRKPCYSLRISRHGPKMG